MKGQRGDGRIPSQAISIPADQLFFVSSELAESLCKPFRYEEREFLALEELVERMLPCFAKSSMRVVSLHELVSGIPWLPSPSETFSTYPIFLPIVDLAIQVGKCKPFFHEQIGRPWYDDAACGLVRFPDADIVWYVEKSLHGPRAKKAVDVCNPGAIIRDVYVLYVWISVLEDACDIAGVLEQAVLFRQPELYCLHRYGIKAARYAEYGRGYSCGQGGCRMRALSSEAAGSWSIST